MTPKASVVIASYNMADTLGNAIESVLSQKCSGIELIVVDDGSEDATREIIENYDGKIRYIYQPNQGKSAARNNGIKTANGEYVALLDADDTLTEDSIETRLEYLEKTGKDAVYAQGNCIDAKGNVYSLRGKQIKSNEKMRALFLGGIKTPFHPMTLMFRKDIFDKIGYYDEKNQRAEDIELILRLVEQCSIGYLEKPVYNYTAITHDRETRLKNRIRGMYDRFKIINQNSSGIDKLKFMAKQSVIQPLKFLYEIFSYRK